MSGRYVIVTLGTAAAMVFLDFKEFELIMFLKVFCLMNLVFPYGLAKLLTRSRAETAKLTACGLAVSLAVFCGSLLFHIKVEPLQSFWAAQENFSACYIRLSDSAAPSDYVRQLDDGIVTFKGIRPGTDGIQEIEAKLGQPGDKQDYGSGEVRLTYGETSFYVSRQTQKLIWLESSSPAVAISGVRPGMMLDEAERILGLASTKRPGDGSEMHSKPWQVNYNCRNENLILESYGPDKPIADIILFYHGTGKQ